MKRTRFIVFALLIILVPFITVDSIGQSSKSDTLIKKIETTLEILKTFHKKYGAATMTLKDRSIYKRIIVHEINSYWIVFLKDGSLHDMLIEKISRIYYGKGEGPIVTFNEENQIVIGY